MNHFGQNLTTRSESSLTEVAAITTQHFGQRPPLIVGTTQGLLLLETEPQMELAGHDITAIASSPTGGWVITDHHIIWHRDPNDKWHEVASVSDVQLNCLLPLKDAIWVGTSGACLIRMKNGNLQRINCFESVEGRNEWYTPWGDPPDVRSLAVSSAGTLYVNVHVGGILRSDDQGQTWQPTIDFQADVHEVCTITDRPDWVLAATAEGLALSEDRGDTWHFDRKNLHGAYARAVAVCGETILLSASTGPHTGKAALYRRPLSQSGNFEKCEQGLPKWFANNINTGTLTTANHFAAFGTQEGEIFGSSDAGQSWRSMATGLAPIRCLASSSICLTPSAKA
jgi:hypothetical protein